MASSETAPPSPPNSANGERASSHEADAGTQARTTKNGRPMPRRIQALGDVPGYPPRGTPIPGHLTCRQVCEGYPNGLYAEVLDPFIHYNWASTQIYEALQQDAKDWMTKNHKDGETGSKNPSNAIAKRLQKRREKHIREGTYQALMNTTHIRREGQDEGFQASGRFPVPMVAPNAALQSLVPLVSQPPAASQPAAFRVADTRAPQGYDLAPRLPADMQPPPLAPVDMLQIPYPDAGRSTVVDPMQDDILGTQHYELPRYNDIMATNGANIALHYVAPMQLPNYGDRINTAINRNQGANWNTPGTYGLNIQRPAQAFSEGNEHRTTRATTGSQQPARAQTWAEAAAAADARHYGLPVPVTRAQALTDLPGQFIDEYGFDPTMDPDEWLDPANLPMPETDFNYDLKDELDPFASAFPGYGQYQ